MRLICPSCGAQYEVDDSVIPAGGRDVQCSNCGTAWFQASAEQQRAEESAAAARSEAEKPSEKPSERAPAEAAEPIAEPVAEAATPPSVATVAEDEDQADGGKEPDPAGDEIGDPSQLASADAAETAARAGGAAAKTGAPAAEAADVFRRRTLDDAVANVLREEAAREESARKEEGSFVEAQPDHGIAAAAAATAAAVNASLAADTDEAPARDRVARLRGDEDDLEDDAAQRASRRELLPDIEEINSTLTATSERGDDAAARDAPETVERRRSGLRRGFSTAILLATILVFFYIMAKPISTYVPALAPALKVYVEKVDKGRVWLDGKMQSLTTRLNTE